MALSGMAISRTGWTLTGLAGLSVWFIGPQAKAAAGAVGGDDFPRALLGLGSLAQLATAGWVILVVALAQLVGSTAVLRAVTPRVLRSALFAGAAGAIAIAPAQADRGDAPPHRPAVVSVVTHDLDGLPFPDRPRTDRPNAPRRDTGPTVGVVIVRPGDSLWTIARQFLPDGASDAEIARSCAAWYAANREVIGSNPDLIIPAQRLRPPTKDHA